MKKPTETALRTACLELLSLCGIWAWKNNTGSAKIGKRFVRFGEPGAPDILGIHPGQKPQRLGEFFRIGAGRLLCIETKIKPNALSLEQAAWLRRASENGAICLVVYELADLESFLRDEGLLR